MQIKIKNIIIFLLFINIYSCKDNVQIKFLNINPGEIGIDFNHNNAHIVNYRYPEIFGSGIAVFDFDLDGDLDLYFVQFDNNQSDQIYKSLFRETGDLRFINVSNELKLNQTGFGNGVSIGDYNNDGFPDIYLSNWKNNILLKNVNGEFFQNVSHESNIAENNEYSIMSTFVDLNNDGWQDIVTINNANYNEIYEADCTLMMGKDYCGPASYSHLKNNILQNQSGIFNFIPQEHSNLKLELPSLALTVFDNNSDGLTDVYVANDNRVNTLWVNQGNFQFSEQGLSSGLAVNSLAKTEASMGIAIGDINLNGFLDFYLTHMWQETNTLYIQQSQGQFSDQTNQYALASPSYEFTGFGTAFLDFESDGDLDIVVANGSIMRNKEGNYNETNSFYENTGEQFILLENSKILSNNPNFSSRGLVRADLDNDGDSDIIISNNNAAPEIYINQSQHSNNWIGYTAYNESGRLLENIESIAEFKNKTIRNIQSRSGSYASSSDPRVLMGLGQYNDSVKVTIRWNQTEFELYLDLKPNQYHKLIKGEGTSALSWPQIKANENNQIIDNNNHLSFAISQLLKSSASELSKKHIQELYDDKTNSGLDLCLSLQSYVLKNEASICYEDYFENEIVIDSDIYYLAAVNEVNKFNYKKAHKYFNLALKIEPENWLYCIRKAQAYFNDNQFAKARIQVQECTSIKDDANNDKLSADIYMAQQQYPKAFDAFREVLKKEPTANHVYYQMGESLKHFQSEEIVNLALAKAGKKKLKIDDTVIGKLVKFNKDPEFHYEKSLLANINQDFETAIGAMARAYELNPTNEKIVRNYALLLKNINQPQQALTVLINQQDHLTEVDSFIALGTMLTQFNQIEKAQDVYLKGLTLHTNNINLLTNLANNYLRINELELAISNYTKILKIDSTNANAITALKRIEN